MWRNPLNANSQNRPHKKKSAKSRAKELSRKCAPRKLCLDALEPREMFSVNSIGFEGNNLVVKSDNAATSVVVSQTASTVKISDLSANRAWTFDAGRVGSVEFRGGAGNDKFVNNVANLPVRAFGGAGNDYLEGYNGADVFVGGAGGDTLVGYGGNDMMWGDDGDDLLLAGAGNDQLMGGAGNDRLIGHAGTDKFWGETGNDAVVSIDAALGEYVDGGAGADTLWVDRAGLSRDGVAGLAAEDMLHEVASFANGADRTLDGDRIADPRALPGQTFKSFANNPLFSSAGPQMTDIRQGELGDC
jgi:Ca2+-binding RTX toxin-like protein